MRTTFDNRAINFRFITLCEPPKPDMIRFLEQIEYGSAGVEHPRRRARVQIIICDDQGHNELHELVVCLQNQVVDHREFLEGRHSYIDPGYMMAVEKACMSNADIQKEIALLQLPEDATVIVEPWAYATDGMNDMSQRTSMVRPKLAVRDRG